MLKLATIHKQSLNKDTQSFVIKSQKNIYFAYPLNTLLKVLTSIKGTPLKNLDSDKTFLENLDLELPIFKTALEFYQNKKYTAGAMAAANILFEKPFSHHPLNELEIPVIAEYLNKNKKNLVNKLKTYADCCLLTETPVRPEHLTDEEYANHYLAAYRTHKKRGSGAYILIRLFHLTGEKKYFDGFIQLAEYSISLLADPKDGDHPPSLAWHPKPGEISGHDPGHVTEELILALPFYRSLLNSEQKLFFLKVFSKIADFCLRSIGKDVQFNIPLHLITPTQLVASVFPEFKKSKTWKTWARNRIAEDYTGKFNVTADGYFREGIGYQSVVHNLLFKNLKFWKASGDKIPKSLLKVSEKSFELVTKLYRLDGTFPLMGDSGAYSNHERHITGSELINVAAVFFNRFDFLNTPYSPSKCEPMEILYWDMGWQGIQKWKNIKKVPSNKQRHLPQDLKKSGFQIFGKGNCANGHHGVLTYACNINHAHFDVGSIEIFGYGRPLITDPGFAGYSVISQAVDTRDSSHSMTMLSRVKPLGPRIENNELTKTNQVVHKNNLQYATCLNPLYEAHTIQRTVSLICPNNKHDIEEPFWVIIDTIRRKFPWPTKTSPYEIAETNFHFNAPDTELGFDYEAKTVWSKHTGKNYKFNRYAGDDIDFVNEPKKIDYHNHLKAIDCKDSNANIQISAIPMKDIYDYNFDIRLKESFTCHYGGRVKRPAVSYMYSGTLPYTCAFILYPFKGVSKNAVVKVNGVYQKNNLLATVESKKYTTNIKINNFDSLKPKITFSRKFN